MSQRIPLPPLVDGSIVADAFPDYDNGEYVYRRATTKHKAGGAAYRVAIPGDVWARYDAAWQAWESANKEVESREVPIAKWKPAEANS